MLGTDDPPGAPPPDAPPPDADPKVSADASPPTVDAPPIGAADPLINEFVSNHSDNPDRYDFVEVTGTPGTSYEEYAIVAIEGDGMTQRGTVDAVVFLGTTNAAGFWWSGYLGETFEAGTMTLLLVQNFTGALSDDLDVDDDGVLDAPPWDRIVDSVATFDGDPSDVTYGLPVLGPDFDAVSNQPGGASRIPEGSDTDQVTDWTRNDFYGAGLPMFTGSPETGEASNTPGAPNGF